MTEMMMIWARIAMGDDALLMREFRWRKRLGWLETPESLMACAKNQPKPIWC